MTNNEWKVYWQDPILDLVRHCVLDNQQKSSKVKTWRIYVKELLIMPLQLKIELILASNKAALAFN
jgi:hypothetical protein